MADKIKFVLALLLVVAGVAAFYLLGESAWLIVRVLCVIVGVLAGAAVGYTTVPGKQFAGFAGESISELKKVVWPTKKETMQTTGAVFAFVVIMALVLFLIDKSVETVIYTLILGWKS
ncbi:preprotein translocase subunit SecE [Viridibacterium curvum]|uniref:Protein translocase subunit SecE n=1 Tax=Viridibacterium curvum TaxID=1101404 RepID=A0ABP9R973_9RHOO